MRLELTCCGIGRAVGELDVLVGECIVVGLATFICLVCTVTIAHYHYNQLLLGHVLYIVGGCWRH